MNVTNLWQ